MSSVTINISAANQWIYFTVDHNALEVGTFQLKVPNGTVDVDWGDGNIEYGIVADNQTLLHTFTKKVTQIGLNFSQGYTSVTEFASTSINFTGSLSQWNILQGLKKLTLYSFNLTGNLSDIFTGLEYIDLKFPIIGDISDLPTTLKEFRVDNVNSSINGNISDFSSNITHIILNGSNISGTIDNLPINLVTFKLRRNNTNITGSISNLPATLKNFYIIGSNNITGSISALPSQMLELYIFGGNNIVTGLLDDLPSTMYSITVGGENAIAGTINNISSSLLYIQIQGLNTISGNISNIPASVIAILIDGNNTITGDIANCITKSFSISGNNTITGNLAAVPKLFTSRQITLRGNNTVINNSSKDYSGLTSFTLYIDPLSINFTPIHLDQLLIDLAAANVKCIIIIVNGERTSNSDSAYNILINNGSNIQIL